MVNYSWKNVFFDLYLVCSFCFAYGIEKENVTAEELLGRLSDDINNRLELWEFCQSANLKILPITDTSMNTITVTFKLIDDKFKDCFTYYDIFLEQKRRTVNAVKVIYIYDFDKRASHTFQNVSCGVYEIVIQPCYNDWQCAPLRVRYPKLLNMSSTDCFDVLPTKLNKNLQSSEDIQMDIIIIAAIISVLFTFISGIVYYCYWRYFRQRHHNANETLFDKRIEENKYDEERVLIKSIHVFIFHYYDRNEQVQRKANIFRDFLVKSSFFSSVKLIETELVEISENPFEWLNKTLDEENDDGNIVKIIIIDSMEDNETEENQIENSIYKQAINILGNNLSRALADYDNLFVVRFDSTQAHSRRIANFVRWQRYLLSNSHHLIDLCINLCSGAGLEPQRVEQRIKELYFRHEVRNLGLVQSV